MTTYSSFKHDIVQEDYNPIVPVGWFTEHTDDGIHPHVATNTDQWYVIDEEEDPIACALVEDFDKSIASLHRLGVVAHHRREGVASVLVGALLAQYDDLEVMCRHSLEANDFYKATGWERVGVVESDPENLVQWTVSATEYDYDLPDPESP